MKSLGLFLLFISLNIFSQEVFNLEPRYRLESVAPNVVHDFGRNIKKTVQYFSKEEANFYKIDLSKGRIVQNGNNYFTDMTRARPHTIYILDIEDNLYLCDCNAINEIHHSSFTQGKAVKAAGEMYIHDGVILELNNLSGHYRPSEQSLNYLIDTIEENGYKWNPWIDVIDRRVEAIKPHFLKGFNKFNPCEINFNL